VLREANRPGFGILRANPTRPETKENPRRQDLRFWPIKPVKVSLRCGVEALDVGAEGA
jgi:hypothetical protein